MSVDAESQEAQPFIVITDEYEEADWNTTGCESVVWQRCMFGLLGSVGMLNLFAVRAFLSVPINQMQEDLNWSSDQQGLALASYFWGYLTLEIISGWVATRWGGKYLLLASVVASGAATIAQPYAARISFAFFLALRIFVGVAQSVSFPATHALLTKWVPPGQNSWLPAIVYSGSFVGIAIALPTAGVISDNLDWEWCFVLFGGLACSWGVFWLPLGSNGPLQSKAKEESMQSPVEGNIQQEFNPTVPPRSVWFLAWKLCINLPLLALIIAHTTALWSLAFFLTELPTYYEKVLGYDSQLSGSLAAIPYVLLLVIWILTGFLSDWLILRGRWSVGCTRKVFHFCGAIVPSICLVLLATLPRSTYLSLGLSITATASFGFNSGGYAVNHLDIGGAIAPLLIGISNTIATVSGIIAPILTTTLLNDQPESPERWEIVFYVSAGIISLGMLIFVVFGKGTPQFEQFCNPK